MLLIGVHPSGDGGDYSPPPKKDPKLQVKAKKTVCITSMLLLFIKFFFGDGTYAPPVISALISNV